MTDDRAILRKTLTANDVGATGSHQVGIHVPKSMARYFPALREAELNPDAWLEVHNDYRRAYWRFIHYNNRVVRAGTRDEYRLTHVTEFLRSQGALPGDVLEFSHVGPKAYRVGVVAKSDDEAGLVLSTSGLWRFVKLPNPR